MIWLREWATSVPVGAFVTVWLLNKYFGGRLATLQGTWDDDRVWGGTAKLFLGLAITLVAAGLRALGFIDPTDVLQLSALQFYPTYAVGKKLRTTLLVLFDGKSKVEAENTGVLPDPRPLGDGAGAGEPG